MRPRFEGSPPARYRQKHQAEGAPVPQHTPLGVRRACDRIAASRDGHASRGLEWSCRLVHVVKVDTVKIVHVVLTILTVSFSRRASQNSKPLFG